MSTLRRREVRTRAGLAAIAALATAAAAATTVTAGPAAPPVGGIHRIRHVIVIMQENRSFDS
ncbi:MAG TPA: hypothetical protein VF196_03810, partial [Casimicrobiaceae bacterium]